MPESDREDGFEVADTESVRRDAARDDRTGRSAAAARIAQQATWVDLQVRQAMERGEFDDLPGQGKPIEDLGVEHDPDWWVKKLVERENIALLPPALALRKEDAELDGRLDADHGRERGAPRGRGLQQAGDRDPPAAAGRPARDHRTARRRRRGGRVARASYGPGRGPARSRRGAAAPAPREASWWSRWREPLTGPGRGSHEGDMRHIRGPAGDGSLRP